MGTALEVALGCVITVYHQYAAPSPRGDSLSRAEFSRLLREAAQPFLRDTAPPHTSTQAYIEQLFAQADTDHDGRLGFPEFLSTLSLVFINAHHRAHRDPQGHHRAHRDPQGHHRAHRDPPGHPHGH